MKVPTIPQNLGEWDISKLNELIQFVDIESETFDFKKEPNELAEHICSMANTRGGFIILGIREIRSKDRTKIIKFEKYGFSHGKQDVTKNKITNSVLAIEPIPLVEIEHIQEEKGGKFYTIIKIENKISDKPYFVKSTDQCFVRIHASKIRANRSTVLNLFSASIERRRNLENLKSACSQTKEAFRYALRDAYGVSDASTMKIPPLDLSYLRNISLSCEWFLRENDLWGEHTGQSSYTHGINSILHDLELLNIYIKSYNLATNQKERQSLKSQLSSWSLGGSYEENTLEMFDRIIDVVDKFLKE